MKGNLKEIAGLFLKLGCIAFGGPAVHIAMMEKEVVRKKKWISHQHFLDLVSATNLIPGPNSTEMTMHCGQERAGWKGLVTAGLCFILPAVIITGIIAYWYKQYGKLPEVTPFIYGIKPAVIAIIITAIIPLAKSSLKNAALVILGIATLAACLFGFNEILALFAAGFIGICIHLIKSGGKTANSIFPLLLVKITNTKIFFSFLKIGALLYGSGYVLFAFLDQELVSKGILTRQELMDAIAVGQFTPGPVFSSATFIGWQIGGFGGAMAATAGIFLPSFIFVALLNPIIPKLRSSKIMSAFLDAVNVASVAIILSVCYSMALESVTDWRTILIALLSLSFALIFKKLNSVFIVIGGSLSGYLLLLV